MAGNWDHIRKEPVSVANTQDELQKLSATAQRAEMAGDSLMASAAHRAINEELDVLGKLKD